MVVVTALVSAADYFRRFNDILSPRVADFTRRRATSRAEPEGRLDVAPRVAVVYLRERDVVAA